MHNYRRLTNDSDRSLSMAKVDLSKRQSPSNYVEKLFAVEFWRTLGVPKPLSTWRPSLLSHARGSIFQTTANSQTQPHFQQNRPIADNPMFLHSAHAIKLTLARTMISSVNVRWLKVPLTAPDCTVQISDVVRCSGAGSLAVIEVRIRPGWCLLCRRLGQPLLKFDRVLHYLGWCHHLLRRGRRSCLSFQRRIFRCGIF